MSTASLLDDVYVTRPKVKARYGLTEMGLWRWENVRPELAFPPRYQLGGRYYYKLSELVAWEEKQKQRAIQKLTKPTSKNGKPLGRPRKSEQSTRLCPDMK